MQVKNYQEISITFALCHFDSRALQRITSPGKIDFHPITFAHIRHCALCQQTICQKMGNSDTKLNFRKAVIQLTTKTQVTNKFLCLAHLPLIFLHSGLQEYAVF